MSKQKKDSIDNVRPSRYEDKNRLRQEPKSDDSIVSYIQKIRFKKRVIGGVDEADVWRKIKGLSDKYEDLLQAYRRVDTNASSRGDAKNTSLAGEAIRTKRRSIADKKEVASFFFRLIGLVAFVCVMIFVIFGLTSMPNNDMSPRISAGDLLFYYRLDKNYSSQDVVVYEVNGSTYVGRIIAKPEDTVEITTDSGLYINGSYVVENDIFYSTKAYDNNIEYPIMLSSDEVFILGDYRDGARDSRYFGAINVSDIKGKVISIIRRSSL